MLGKCIRSASSKARGRLQDLMLQVSLVIHPGGVEIVGLVCTKCLQIIDRKSDIFIHK